MRKRMSLSRKFSTWRQTKKLYIVYVENLTMKTSLWSNVTYARIGFTEGNVIPYLCIEIKERTVFISMESGLYRLTSAMLTFVVKTIKYKIPQWRLILGILEIIPTLTLEFCNSCLLYSSHGSTFELWYLCLC